MPSGNTAAIYEGEDVSLRDYLMRIGRGMGFAIMQRDDPIDAPVKPVEPSTRYHDEQIEKAQQTLRLLDGMTITEARNRAVAEFEEAEAKWFQTREKKLSLRRRYEAMLAQVEAWEPGPLMASTKDYAIEQLRQSIDFDCGQPGEEMKFYDPPKRLSGAEWLNQTRAKAERDIECAREQIAEQQERTAERNRHIRAFLDSLPPEEASADAA